MPPIQEPMMGQPLMDMGGEQEQFGGTDPNMQNPEGSEFDTGFDAGVEADEDTDPKKFIQQLTGKLSQSLNKYNNENGDDEELSKYVGKMIVKAAAKGMDENGRKDLIKSINTTDEPEEAEPETEPVDEPSEEMPPVDELQMNECVYTKRDLKKIMEEFNQELTDNDSEKVVKKQKVKKTKTAFSPKDFTKK